MNGKRAFELFIYAITGKKLGDRIAGTDIALK